jgi:hypothetical protein
LIRESQIRFVDESGAVECVAVVPASSLLMGEAMQLVVDERKKLVQRIAIPDAQLGQETRDRFLSLVSRP